MKILTRSLEKDQTDWETVAGLGIVPLFLLVCFILPKWFPGLLPRCRFHDLTGLPCPGCGSVRCAEHLMKGRFLEAFLAQPLGFLLAVACALFMLYSAAVVAFGLPRVRLSGRSRVWKLAGALAVFAFLANWAYLILAGD